MAAAKGHDADHHFLQHMIEHHKDGIQMIQASMPNLKHPELRGMAEKIVKDQQDDSAKMQKIMH